MMSTPDQYDAVVIGGGFYGCAIAVYLVEQRHLKNVLIVEREADLLSRASYTNQARVHNGYHYPRSFTTAYRSRINLPRFIEDWSSAIKTDFTKLYAIARRNSHVTSRQFERFCHEIGAELLPAPDHLNSLFNTKLIQSVYSVKEYAFDTVKLAEQAYASLTRCNVQTKLSTEVTAITQSDSHNMSVMLCNKHGTEHMVHSKLVFNCTYSGLNQIRGDFEGSRSKLKHEITEMALVSLPEQLENVGITVMDGPFFSIMPFPARNCYTLSHVRYTPHYNWADNPTINPYDTLDQYECQTRVDRMIRDTARYVPSVAEAKYIDSLFEVKTVLQKNESDDGRPILFEQSQNLPGFYSILGGKIDNIYDILEFIDNLKV